MTKKANKNTTKNSNLETNSSTITLTALQLTQMVGERIQLAKSINMPECYFPAYCTILIKSADDRHLTDPRFSPAVTIEDAAGYRALIGFEIEAYR